MRASISRIAVPLTAALVVLAAPGCRRDMQDQPRYDPFEVSAFFADGRASRPRVPGRGFRLQREQEQFIARRNAEFGKPSYDLKKAMQERLLEINGVDGY